MQRRVMALASAVLAAVTFAGTTAAHASPPMSVTEYERASSTGTASSSATYDNASGGLALTADATERTALALPIYLPGVPASNSSRAEALGGARIEVPVAPGEHVARFRLEDVNVTESASQRGISVLGGNTIANSTLLLGIHVVGGAWNPGQPWEYEESGIDRIDFDCPANCALAEALLTVPFTVPSNVTNAYVFVSARAIADAHAVADGAASASLSGRVVEFTVAPA